MGYDDHSYYSCSVPWAEEGGGRSNIMYHLSFFVHCSRTRSGGNNNEAVQSRHTSIYTYLEHEGTVGIIKDVEGVDIEERWGGGVTILKSRVEGYIFRTLNCF